MAKTPCRHFQGSATQWPKLCPQGRGGEWAWARSLRPSIRNTDMILIVCAFTYFKTENLTAPRRQRFSDCLWVYHSAIISLLKIQSLENEEIFVILKCWPIGRGRGEEANPSAVALRSKVCTTIAGPCNAGAGARGTEQTFFLSRSPLVSKGEGEKKGDEHGSSSLHSPM